jgi:hypothetical protein
MMATGRLARLSLVPTRGVRSSRVTVPPISMNVDGSIPPVSMTVNID